ncbi:hypothetical protein OXYTRIMIC_491 [Oxytricha trifallax]|uniref:Uncharacterized protein n=1 Tax=Oxytricha trifallax TaxID=1172189 RepID=A0A073HXN6_9SPIT|nr:hypothetical protein OXYTRIMIC_491 [Oxytricha trifallax]
MSILTTTINFFSSNQKEKLRDEQGGMSDLQRTKEKKQEENKQHKQQEIDSGAKIELKICLQNVRGLSSKLKKDQVMREIEIRQPDFLRLQRLIGLNSEDIIQTQLARNGGVLTMNSGQYEMKTIKTLRQLLAWNMLNVGGFPQHIITIYILPYVNQEVKELQNRLKYMQKYIYIYIYDLIYQTEVQQTEDHSYGRLQLPLQRNRQGIKRIYT